MSRIRWPRGHTMRFGQIVENRRRTVRIASPIAIAVLVSTAGVLSLALIGPASRVPSGKHAPAVRNVPFAGLGADRPQPASGAVRARVASAYGRLPLAFQPRRGGAAFVARGAGSTVLLSSRAAVVALARSGARKARFAVAGWSGSHSAATTARGRW